MPTTRAARARVTGQDVDGRPVAHEGEGLSARCFQHEVDHLDGVLYVDRHPPAVRARADEHLRAQDWFGTPAIDPRSLAYTRAQSADADLDPLSSGG